MTQHYNPESEHLMLLHSIPIPISYSITEDNNELGEGFLLQATYTVLHDDGTILTWHHCRDANKSDKKE